MIYFQFFLDFNLITNCFSILKIDERIETAGYNATSEKKNIEQWYSGLEKLDQNSKPER